ncbi:MAG: cytochrome c biogenesis protein CcdA [Candidatus Thermoplasmatota archaeon]|nr:cytochrome c biogenesis protein CcdA [Candidatus Thermoplasmatota archaeon]
MSEDAQEGMFTAVGDPEDPDLVEIPVEEKVTKVVAEEWKPSLRYRIQQKTGCDLGVFSERNTWYAFAISVILFSVIATAGLSIFESTSASFGTSDDVEPAPDFVTPTLNRTAYEANYTNENGTLQLSELRGHTVILDFMAVACSNCHHVQNHLEASQAQYEALEGPHPVVIVSIGVWWDSEDFDDINETFGSGDRMMPWVVAVADGDDVITNDTITSIVAHYSAQAIPLALVLDHEGYMVHKTNTGTPSDQWKSFDEAVELSVKGEAESIRIGLAKVDTSPWAIFALGMMLGVLVYFSPCAFPILPSYIGYYISLGAREDELRESGKLEGRMPGHFSVGFLSGMGMLTFFLILGLLVIGLAEIVPISLYLHNFALGIAILLIILGSFMLMGGTAHLLGWVDKLIVQRFSTTEMDDKFTPRRNMYLWGIGYAAGSIDCTAAAVIPFVGYLAAIGGSSMYTGLAGIMLSVLLLMTIVTGMVGTGRDMFRQILMKASGMIKLVGSWMMMFAGIMLTIYLTNAELTNAIL